MILKTISIRNFLAVLILAGCATQTENHKETDVTAGPPAGSGSYEGWHGSNEHYKTSTYCWAMYLRLMKRFVEHGDVVAYEKRLNV